MTTAFKYHQLIKPSWAPPVWLFGPVWSFLYVIILVSYGGVLYLFLSEQIPWMVALPFVFNLVFNFAYTPIQFSLCNNMLALIDILLVVGTLIWALIAIWPFEPWIAYANLPYLLWILFATLLQSTITVLNWDKEPKIRIAK